MWSHLLHLEPPFENRTTTISDPAHSKVASRLVHFLQADTGHIGSGCNTGPFIESKSLYMITPIHITNVKEFARRPTNVARTGGHGRMPLPPLTSLPAYFHSLLYSLTRRLLVCPVYCSGQEEEPMAKKSGALVRVSGSPSRNDTLTCRSTMWVHDVRYQAGWILLLALVTTLRAAWACGSRYLHRVHVGHGGGLCIRRNQH